MKRAIRILFACFASQFLMMFVAILLNKLGVDIGGWGMTFIPRAIGFLSFWGLIGTPILSFIYYRTHKRLDTELAIYTMICLFIWAIYIFAYFAFSGFGEGGLF